MSLRPVLKEPGAPWRDYLVSEFHFHGGRPFFPRRAIRDQRYKLIHNLLAEKVRPSTGIDGDPAYRVSQSEAYAGTRIGKAFAVFANPPEFELYDLKNDPVEFENLAGDPAHRALRQRLTEALLAYRKRTDDPALRVEWVEELRRRVPRPSATAGTGAMGQSRGRGEDCP